ncbi:hypothetical protein B0H10DRAFT_2433600 [Mycena sp. CBHHK59/15]|nr:hypothetical protein B0H10DRAFT_2108013 [Mycena sp. CBHHK59/15]KAJ6602972.1 hypothetical protein B0H10DRAFT_2195950 [Mycena sp. CBHHK59/15]KAJ6619089.1 hypothetical protein B0H10DRAFT_2433600 [Mycena sp. CBHHK59/15]
MDEPFMATLYKSDDEQIEVDLEPLVYDAWSSAEAPAPADAQWSSLVRRVGELVNGRPVAARTRKPFESTDTVMDIQLDGGRKVFARALTCRVNCAEDPVEMWKCSRLSAELSILCWLEVNGSGLPVPRVFAFDDVNCLLVTTVMPGLDAMHSYPRLSTAAKEHSVVSWARVSVLMFRVAVPQRFGMVENPSVPGRPHIYVSPQHTFDTSNTTDLLSFFNGAIATRRTRSLTVNDPENHDLLCTRLDRLLEGLKPLIARAQDTPSMSRFALTHRDLRANNTMLDETSGEVVGIVDWEFNECMPACMSAAYPDWIRQPIVQSPLYKNPNSTIVTFFLEPQTERNRLCDLYEKAVKELNDDYYNCLIHGTRLRDALDWIEIDHNRDNDGVRMGRWTEEHLFPTVVEVDHRCA